MVKHEYKGYTVNHITVDGVTFFDPKFFYIASNFKRIIKNPSREFIHVSKCNLHRTAKVGRSAKLMINPDGIVEYLQKKICYTDNEIESVLFWLKSKSLIDKVFMSMSRKEIAFKNEIISFFEMFDIEVESQVEHESVIIDFVVGGRLAVEYDEDKHSGYDNDSELKREEVIKGKYKLIRVDDSCSNGHNLACITKKIGGFTWHNK